MSLKEKYVSHPLLAQLPVFFQPWWLDIVSDNWHVALAERDGRLAGVWPYAVDRKLGFRIIRNPLLTPYLGPFFFYPDDLSDNEREQVEQEVFNTLWQQIPSWDSFDLETTTSFANSRLFIQKGFSCIPKITYENDLAAGETQLFKAMHSNHRNLIRQAESRHEIVTGEAYIPGLLQLHKATFHRKNKPYPFDPGITEALIRESIARGAGQLFAAKDTGNNITANIFTVWDREKMYLLLSTTDPETAHPGAVRLLIWHAMKTAQQKGIRIFDFEGSMDPGIAAFFSRFGGTGKTYLCLTKHQSLLWKWKKALLG
jgi:hypothetical protein